MTTLGIIGYGDFGTLMADLLQGKMTVKVYSRTSSKVPESIRATFEEVCASDYLIPTIPLEAYDETLAKVAEHINPNTVIVDICSVKIKPVEFIKKHLPNNKLVATHPLFGPQTAAAGLDKHVMVICDDVSDALGVQKIALLSESIGLKVVYMSAGEHDRQMAQVHALTFFVARVLRNISVHDVTLKTPSFEHILDLVALDESQSEELFETIELGNPFASELRQSFAKEVASLAAKLDIEK